LTFTRKRPLSMSFCVIYLCLFVPYLFMRNKEDTQWVEILSSPIAYGIYYLSFLHLPRMIPFLVIPIIMHKVWISVVMALMRR
jgi:hypothetical protein